MRTQIGWGECTNRDAEDVARSTVGTKLARVTAGAGFYYYLRVVAAMYWQEPGDETPITVAQLTKLAIVGLTFFIFVFGIFPQPILKSLRGVPIQSRVVAQPVAVK